MTIYRLLFLFHVILISCDTCYFLSTQEIKTEKTWCEALSKLYNRSRRKDNRKSTKETINFFETICKDQGIESVEDINSLKASCFDKKSLSNDKYELDILKLFFLLKKREKNNSELNQKEEQKNDYTSNSSPSLLLATSILKVCFSPCGGCENMLIKIVKKAKNSLYIATFVLTSMNIANAIIAQHDDGVQISIVTDEGRSKTKNSKCPILYKKGIPIRTGKNTYMHHKFVIVDKESILTGSFNYSERSEKNNSENLLYVKNKDLVEKYFLEWKKLWKEGKVYKPSID